MKVYTVEEPTGSQHYGEDKADGLRFRGRIKRVSEFLSLSESNRPATVGILKRWRKFKNAAFPNPHINHPIQPTSSIAIIIQYSVFGRSGKN